MIIRSKNNLLLLQTITDQILLVVNGTYSQSVLRCWHISQKKEALYDWNRVTS
jgi:hypothetical protein